MASAMPISQIDAQELHARASSGRDRKAVGESAAIGVIVLMMKVGRVRMRVLDRSMAMDMAVRCLDVGVVKVVVMTVVMTMRVFMLHCLVLMRMSVMFSEVEEDSDHEEDSGNPSACRKPAVPHDPGCGCTDERREGKDRAGSPRADLALRQQVEAQADPVPQRSARSDADGVSDTRERLL